MKSRLSHPGKENGNYKHGKYCSIHYCLDCKRKISIHAIRCRACSNIKTSKLRMKNRRSYKGKNAPSYLDGRTLKKYYCIDCSKQINYYTWWIGTKRCKSCAKKGKRNIRYIHGQGNSPYSLEFSYRLKEQIRKRDNYICQLCGVKQENYYQKLSIHHIDYNKENYNKNNLITLCRGCNTEANGNIDYYYAYFTYILERK